MGWEHRLTNTAGPDSIRLKVLLITNIPTSYRIPLFNGLNAQLARLGIGFKVIFACARLLALQMENRLEPGRLCMSGAE